MRTNLSACLALGRAMVMPRANLILENAALLQQLLMALRSKSRPLLRPADRIFWIILRRLWPEWAGALLVVKPATVIGWHRRGFKALWRWKSKPGRPRIPRRHIAFIRRMSADHPEWGEDRIVEELVAKCGIRHSGSTVRRYMVPRGRPPRASQTWQTFVRNHGADLWACDFLYRCHLDRWLGEVLNVAGIPIPYGAPNASPHIERFNRTLREEALDHFLFVSVAHVRRIVNAYVAYYNGARPSQAIHAIPAPYPELTPPPPATSSRCQCWAASTTITDSQRSGQSVAPACLGRAGASAPGPNRLRAPPDLLVPCAAPGDDLPSPCPADFHVRRVRSPPRVTSFRGLPAIGLANFSESVCTVAIDAIDGSYQM